MSNDGPSRPRAVWKARIWMVFSFLTIGLLLWRVSAAGARREFPVLSSRLQEIELPGFSLLAGYQNLDQLDLASVFSLVLLVGSYSGLVYAFRGLIYEHIALNVRNLLAAKWIHIVLGFALMCLDATLFALGLAHEQQGWGQQTITLGSVVGGVAYGIALALIALIAVHLEDHR